MRVYRILLFWALTTSAIIGVCNVQAQPARSSPEDAGAFVRALTDAWLGSHQTALATLEGLAREQPHASVYAAMADVYAGMGRELDAREALESAVAASPSEASYALALGTLLEEGGLPDEAEAIYRSVLASDQGNGPALAALARLEADRGNTVEAMRLLRRASSTAPTLASLDLARNLVSTETNGDQHATSKEEQTTVSTEEAVSSDDVEGVLAQLDSNRQDIDAWLEALESLAAHPHPRAVRVAEDALLLFPGRPEFVIPAAEVLVENGEESKAESAVTALLDESSSPDPDLLARAWGVVAVGNAVLGRVDEAYTALEMISDLRPGGVAFWHARGHVDAANGDKDAAQQAWRRALELQPDHEVIASHMNEQPPGSAQGPGGRP